MPCVRQPPSSSISSGHVVEGLDDLGWQGKFIDAEGRLQLGGGAGADDRRGHPRSVTDPDQGDLERRPVKTFTGAYDGLDDPLGLLTHVVADEAGKMWRGSA